jgi:hypothetical protein
VKEDVNAWKEAESVWPRGRTTAGSRGDYKRVLHRIKRLLAAILSPMRIESAALTGTPTKIAATAAAGLTVERRSHGRLRESACVLLGNRWAPSRHENHHPLGSS